MSMPWNRLPGLSWDSIPRKGGGGGGNQVTSTRVEYSPEEEARRQRIFDIGEELYNRFAPTAGTYRGPTPVGFDPATLLSQGLGTFMAGQGTNAVGNALTLPASIGNMYSSLQPSSTSAINNATQAARMVSEPARGAMERALGGQVVVPSSLGLGANELATINQAQARPNASANAATEALNFGLTGAVDVRNNPYLQEAMRAAIAPQFQALREETLPALRLGAVGSGTMGSSRQGIAEGLAAGRTADAAARTVAQMGSAAYGQGLDAQGRALSQFGDLTRTALTAAGMPSDIATRGFSAAGQVQGQGLANYSDLLRTSVSAATRPAELALEGARAVPNLVNAGQVPVGLLSQIGAQRENLAQEVANYEANQRTAEINQPWEMLQAYASLLQGMSNPVTTSTNQLPRQGITPMQGIGAGLGAISLIGKLAGCWVAQLVFGPASWRWVLFRAWLELHPTVKWAYMRWGQRVAKWLAPRPRAQAIVRSLMNRCIAEATHGLP